MSRRARAVRKLTKDYEIIDRNILFQGMTYSDLLQDWFNWFLCTDADKRTLGSVVFLRSKGAPVSENGDIKDSRDNQGQAVTYGDDPLFYPRKYQNDPNIRVGSDRYQIYTDQAIFIPIIVSYWVATKPYHDWGIMHEFNGLTIDYGDEPTKDQFKIYDLEEDISPGKRGNPNIRLENFRVRTPIFTAIIPDSEYGRSNRDFLEDSVIPGQYPAMVEGYFVLIRFIKPPTNGKNYFIHTWASAPREVNGPYFSELFYEIEIMEKRDKPGFRRARNEGVLAKVLNEKMKLGQLDTSVGQAAGRVLKTENLVRMP